MEYEGKLYGKVGGEYFPMIETTEDIKRYKQRIKELEEQVSNTDLLHSVSKSALYKTKKKFKHNHKVCGCGRPYSQKDLEDGMCNKCFAPTM